MEPDNASLIVEALMREMAIARRWSTVETAWQALLRVRHMANEHAEQMEKITPNPNIGKRGRRD